MRKLLLIGFVVLGLVAVAGCNGAEEAENPPSAVQQEEINTVARNHLRDQVNFPAVYELEVDTVRDGWARVTVTPEDIEAEPQVLYLRQEQTGERPWTVELGPQTDFTADELDEAGVPESVRQ